MIRYKKNPFTSSPPTPRCEIYLGCLNGLPVDLSTELAKKLLPLSGLDLGRKLEEIANNGAGGCEKTQKCILGTLENFYKYGKNEVA